LYSAFFLPEVAINSNVQSGGRVSFASHCRANWHQFMPLEYVHLLNADSMSGTVPLVDSEIELT
jgi:hypothetical protein